MRYVTEHPHLWKLAATIGILLFCVLLAYRQRGYGKLKERWEAELERCDEAQARVDFYGLRAGLMTSMILFLVVANIALWIFG